MVKIIFIDNNTHNKVSLLNPAMTTAGEKKDAHVPDTQETKKFNRITGFLSPMRHPGPVGSSVSPALTEMCSNGVFVRKEPLDNSLGNAAYLEWHAAARAC